MKIPLSPSHLVPLSTPSRLRRASVLIVTLWTIIGLTGMILVMVHSTRVEALAASNRLAAAQAEAAERGAEQYVLSAVDMEVKTPGSTSTEDMQAAMAGLNIGNAYVWIIKPDPDDETALAFGLTDEASKLDLNSATNDQLINLPNMSQDIVDSILDWRDADSTPGSQGAEDSYYSALANPYHCKNANFETVEELLLVKGVDAQLLFGNDTARSGRATASSSGANVLPGQIDLLGTNLGTNSSNRGIFPYITIYGLKAGTAPATSVTSGNLTLTATLAADVNAPDPAQTALRNTLQKYLGGGGNITQILRDTQNRIDAGHRFPNIWDWAVAVNLPTADFAKVMNYLRASQFTRGFFVATTAVAKINVNTAPKEVLMCLPSLTESDAMAIVAHRQTNTSPTDPSDISWLLDVVPKAKFAAMGSYVTGISYCFSADILAATADGRAFKRCRIVVDASSGKAKIIYRRDLTAYGWPLPPEYRESLRLHKGPDPDSPITGALPS